MNKQSPETTNTNMNNLHRQREQAREEKGILNKEKKIYTSREQLEGMLTIQGTKANSQMQ